MTFWREQGCKFDSSAVCSNCWSARNDPGVSIGEGGDFVANVNSSLGLRINDVDNGFGDNRGSIRVMVVRTG